MPYMHSTARAAVAWYPFLMGKRLSSAHSAICAQLSAVSAASGGTRRLCGWTASRPKQLLKNFWIALKTLPDAAHKANLSEVILIYLPFWAVWGGVAGHFLGYTDKDKEIYPLENHTVENLGWNVAACDVGEFGVSHINLEGCLLEPFDSEALHRTGMVFEPLGSAKEIYEAAQDKLIDQLITSNKQPNASQEFARIIESSMGLVYYPLWVVRYLYNGRVFQVVVDGYSGEVLYGQAPANTLHRATVMVFNMALGSVMVAAAAGLANIFSKNIQISLFCIAVALPWLVLLVYGAAFMYYAWNKYKNRGHYKFVRLKSGTGTPRILSIDSQGQNDMDDFIKGLEGLI